MISIAIDGPAGAGKSTIAKAVAKDLGFTYVDTGALYRTVALRLLSEHISTDDEDAVKRALDTMNVDLSYQDGVQHVFLDGEDVSGLIRTPEVSMMASTSSALPIVRAFLLDLQRDMAKRYDVIMDGRDIGTVVLPNATVKIFLTADVEDRAMRRYLELVEKDASTKYEDVLHDVKKRDEQDMNRPVAPLRPAEDSIYINTSGNSLEQSVALIKSTIIKNAGISL